MKKLFLILFLFIGGYVQGQVVALNNNPRVYNVNLFGAVPDGVETNDGAIASASQTLTCTTCGFTSAAVGKYIIVSGAGAAGASLATTISGFTNSTTVTLTAAAGTTIASAGNVIWGTENTAFIQAAINAAFTAGGGRVFFPYGTSGGMYIIGAALTANTPLGYAVNSQIYIPSNSVLAANSVNRTAITLEGEYIGPQYPISGPFVVALFAKTSVILRSTISGSGNLPSAIGFPNVTDGFVGVGSTDGIFKNLWVKVYTNKGALAPTMTGINGNYSSKMCLYNMAATIDVAPQSSQDPSTKEVAGFIIGKKNDNGPNIIDQCFAQGFKYGFVLGEHTNVLSLFSSVNYYGIAVPAADYAIRGFAILHWNRIEIYSPTASATSFLDGLGVAGQCNTTLDVEIETLDTAVGTRWYGGHLQPRIADTSGFLRGNVRTTPIFGGGTKDVPMQIQGAANLVVNYLQDNSNWVNNNSLLSFTSLGMRSYYASGFANLGIGSLRMQGIALNSGIIGDNAHLNVGGASFSYDSTGFCGFLHFASGSMVYRSAVSGIAGAAASIRNTLSINNDLSFGIGGNSTFATAAGYSLNGSTAGVITPGATNTQDFGSSSLLWRDIYARGIVGVTTNSNAQTGSVGEYVSSLVAIGSPVSLSNGTGANVTSISLTAGDWDVDGQVSFTETTSTVTARSAGVTSTTATVPVDGSEAYCGIQSTVTSETNSISLVKKRFSLSGTTTIFLVGKASFSAGTCGVFGFLSARRVR